MNDLINMIIFSLVLLIFIVYFRDINYKKVITLIKNDQYKFKNE